MHFHFQNVTQYVVLLSEIVIVIHWCIYSIVLETVLNGNSNSKV